MRFTYSWLTLAGVLACQDPTQITVQVTTDARCPDEGPGDAVLESAGIAAARDFASGEPATFSARRDFCDAPRTVGSLVLVPAEGRSDNLVEVLIVGGFQTDDGKLPQTAESCEEIRAASGIDGLNCIVARRRLGFIANTPLTLPIDLDTRCLGVECGEDLTCFQGQCVSPEVDCDANGDCPLGAEGGAGGAGGAGAGGDGGAPSGGGGDGGSGGGSTLEICDNGMDDTPEDAALDCDHPTCVGTLHCSAEERPLVLNEVSIRSDEEAAEFIELLNRSAAPLSLDGATVTLLHGPASGTSTAYASYSLDGITLPAGGYLLIGDAGLPATDATTIELPPPASDDHLDQSLPVGVIAVTLGGAQAATTELLDALVYGALPSGFSVDGVTFDPLPYAISDSESPTAEDSVARIPNGALGVQDDVWRVTTTVTLAGANMVSAGTEDCSNGSDDDDPDSDADCEDSECDAQPCAVDGQLCDLATGTCACPGGSTETLATCGNGVDDDCDGLSDCLDPNCAAAPNCVENCTDQIENDGDGDVDCADADCAATAFCLEDCANGMDDADVDADADCADSECAASPSCAEICDNGMDDADVDGDEDCADSECAGELCGPFGRTCTNGSCVCPSGSVEDCDNLVDDDCDGFADCADVGCVASPSCGEICTNGVDDSDADLDADCLDSDCAGAVCGPNGRTCMGLMCLCPLGFVEVCGDSLDNDCNGVADCDDAACAGSCVESCNNMLDDDQDLLVDCADDDCFGSSCGPFGQQCTAGTCLCPGGNVETFCDDLGDDDCDGATDCADTDCGGAPACNPTGDVLITMLDYPVVSRAGRLTVGGSGFLGVTTVVIGGALQPFTVLNDTTLVVSSVNLATPTGVQMLTLIAGSKASTAAITVINLLLDEIDSAPGGNTNFVKLRTGVPGAFLGGHSLALISGATNQVVGSLDLSGTTDPSGYYLVGGAGVNPTPNQLLLDVPEGVAAAAIYQSPALPTGTVITSNVPTISPLDALVYGTGMAPAMDDLTTLLLMNGGVIINEFPNSGSIARCDDFLRRDVLAIDFAMTPNPGGTLPSSGLCNQLDMQ
jgi:hypothetical protein